MAMGMGAASARLTAELDCSTIPANSSALARPDMIAMMMAVGCMNSFAVLLVAVRGQMPQLGFADGRGTMPAVVPSFRRRLMRPESRRRHERRRRCGRSYFRT